MYKIIGADKKEYGPVSTEQLREWIQQGRVSAQTLAQAEGQTDWRPIIAFPEFADVIGAAPGTSATPAAFAAGGGRDAALAVVKGPAIGLMLVASLAMVLVVISLVINLTGFAVFPMPTSGQSPQFAKFAQGVGGVVGAILGLAIYATVFFGALKMKKLENHGLAMTASILALLPCSLCCLFGLPFGIWALVVLSKPEVKSQFS